MKKTLLWGLCLIGLASFGQAGSLDTGFDGDGRAYTFFNNVLDRSADVAVQPDGKILVAGDTGLFVSTNPSDYAICRYNPNGSLDASFGSGGKAIFNVLTSGSNQSDIAFRVLLQSDGKILVAGFSNTIYFSVIRLNSDGTLDTTYGDGTGKLTFNFGGNDITVNSAVLQPDGKLIMVGQSRNSGSPSQYDYAIARITTDGALDLDFSNDGKLVVDFGNGSDEAMGVAVDTDGKIVVAGYGGSGGILKLNPDGSIDNGFGTAGKVILPGTGFQDVAIQPDGKIVVIGGVTNGNMLAARFNADGTADDSFGTGGMVTSEVDSGGFNYFTSVLLQPDGKILVGGGVTTGGTGYFGVVRLTANGILDTTFSFDGIQLTAMDGSLGKRMAFQGDGKLLMTGFGTSMGFATARFNMDISLAAPQSVRDDFAVYPNPVSDRLYFNGLPDDLPGSGFTISNALGQTVRTGTVPSKADALNVSGLPKGTYFLRFALRDTVRKIIVE
jgi:uncharacterized delta-60 repeat protein